MADILEFKRPPKKKTRNTLCKNGHHKWKVDTKQKFDTGTSVLFKRAACRAFLPQNQGAPTPAC